MASSTLTSKGQMTLPKAVRQKLRLKAGDRFEVSVQDKSIVLTPATLDLDALCSVLPPAKRALSTKEIDAVIRKRFSKRK